MGVRGLQTFLRDQVPNGVFPVNIIEEIHRSRRKDPEKPVVLVFHVMDILYNIAFNLQKIDIICGPPHRKIHDIFDKSFKQLREAGATLNFFIDGPKHEVNSETWAHLQSERYAITLKVFDAVESQLPIKCITQLMDKPIGVSTSSYHIRTLCQHHGTLHISMNPKCVVDIATFSKEHDVFAVVTNNTDLLIFEGDWRYWTCADINLIELNWNTLEYSKLALREYLGLCQPQLILLATISGNEFVPFDELKRFHNKIRSREICYFKQHFLDLAKYVQPYSDELSDKETETLSLGVFGSTYLQHFRMIKDSMNFYAMKIQPTQTEEEMDELFIQAAFESTYHHCLTETPIKMRLPNFYDLRRIDFLSYFDIELPILKRQIGFVRKHKNDINYRQVVEAKLSHSEPYRFQLISPEYPKVEIPDLMEITFNRTNHYMNNIRFRLLKWMIFGNDFQPQFLIQNIPNGYMVAVVTLMYLMNLKQLSPLEADAILVSILLINENKEYLEGIPFPITIPSSRLLLVSHLYICVHNVMVKSFYFVGLNDFIDFLTFDGSYFIYWVKELKSKNQIAYEDAVDRIQFLKYYLRFVANE